MAAALAAQVAAGPVPPAPDAVSAVAPAPVTVDLSAAQVLELASARAASGDVAGAISLFTALAKDLDVDIRSEARFRHGRLQETQCRFAEAAVLYRAISG